ncbi:MAG: KH domain-containing protein [Acidimicrobiia bacterium]|nr:KH domain-containing protein [Acidimicrobiia bacterium]
MSEWKEVRGETREDALDEAVRVLGVAPMDMEIDDVATEEVGDEVVLRVRVPDDLPSAEPVAAVEPVVAEDAPAPTGGRGSGPTEEEIGEQRDVVLDFLVDLLEAFDLDGEIAAEHKDGVLTVDISGEDLGSLIGRRGMTLAALAEVTKTVIQRRTAARVRLQLDVQGYRARRREALRKYASDLAQDVLDQGGEKALEPMPAADRKVVHDAVADVDGVRSYSEGTDPKRYVVISPV